MPLPKYLKIAIFCEHSNPIARSIFQDLNLLKKILEIRLLNRRLKDGKIKFFSKEEIKKRISKNDKLFDDAYLKSLIITVGYTPIEIIGILNDVRLNENLGFTGRFIAIMNSSKEQNELLFLSIFGQEGYKNYQGLKGHSVLIARDPSLWRRLCEEILLVDKTYFDSMMNFTEFRLLKEGSQFFRFSSNFNNTKIDNISTIDDINSWSHELNKLLNLNLDVIYPDHVRAGEARNLIAELLKNIQSCEINVFRINLHILKDSLPH